MLARLEIITVFGLIMGGVCVWCLRTAPRRGLMRALECVCAGIILFYLASVALMPLGLRLPQSPLAAVSSGLLGLPGAALAAITQLMP